ncbi:MAG TPA: SLC13 family permease [Methanolinea sp.]|nr:SLC13 family permease [Methanolinea sp.]
MDTSILLLGGVLAVTVILFVSDRVRIDLVAILASLSLAWLGLISPMEAFSGFASNAVIAMAAVMILGFGIERTGVTSRIANAIIRYAGTSEQRVVATTSMTVGCLSSVLQNIGSAALFLPALRRIGKQTRIPVSRLMMPMGFAAILGGSITMIGSSPLIVLNDLLRQSDAEPFSLFAVTPIGVPLLVAGVLLFAFAGDRILPKKEEKAGKTTVAEIWGSITRSGQRPSLPRRPLWERPGKRRFSRCGTALTYSPFVSCGRSLLHPRVQHGSRKARNLHSSGRRRGS